MRKIFPLIMGLLLLFAAPTFSQDTLVHIRPETARYFLEKEDEVFVLREKDSISNELIYNQSVMLDMKDRIIQTYKQDSITYKTRDETFSNHIRLIREEHTKQTKRLTKARNVGVGIGAGAIIGSVIPGVGTVTGAAVGGAVGWVVSVLKRN